MQAEVSDDNIVDKSEVLAPKAVRAYTQKLVESGRGEYNNGSILVRSGHPLDECMRRGIIEQEHHDGGKRIQSYRDCALSKTKGRTYNATGEGDSEMDAGTIYARVLRKMSSTPYLSRRWDLISIICFAEPNVDGIYRLNSADYDALFKVAPDIRYSFELIDTELSEAKKELRRKIDEKHEAEGRTPFSPG